MKLVLFFLLAVPFSTLAQQSPAPGPDAPTLTLEEKITLSTDDIKLQDAAEKANKAFILATKDLREHQKAAIGAIEKDHPGWELKPTPDGWHFEKKAEVPKKP